MTAKAAPRPAPRPAPRRFDVTLEVGDFAGWHAAGRADFPAGLLVDLESGRLERIMAVLDVIVDDHNMPGADGEVAATMAEVDPYDGLLAISSGIFDAIGKLPNR